jgi:Ca2+-binding EF-hand superfamily protein
VSCCRRHGSIDAVAVRVDAAPSAMLGCDANVRRSSRSSESCSLISALSDLGQPPVLTECIFDAFDSGGRGTVDLNDFLYGIAILTRGSQEQRLRFLFNVYDVRRSGVVEHNRLRRFLNVIYGESIAQHEPTQRMLHSLFSHVKRAGELDVDEFLDRVGKQHRMKVSPIG